MHYDRDEIELMIFINKILEEVSEDMKHRYAQVSSETKKLLKANREACDKLESMENGREKDRLSAQINKTCDKIKTLQDDAIFGLGEQSGVLEVRERIADFCKLYFSEPTSLS